MSTMIYNKTLNMYVQCCMLLYVVLFIFVVLMFIENAYLFTMFVLLFLCRIVVNNNQQFQIKKYLPDFDLYVHIKYTTI